MKVSKEQINLRKLQKEEIWQEVEIEVTKKLKDVNSTELTEETWSVFKNTQVEALKETCGTRKTGGQTKQTVWWNDTVKEAIREKKLYKVCVKTKVEEDYIRYRYKMT